MEHATQSDYDLKKPDQLSSILVTKLNPSQLSNYIYQYKVNL